MSNPITRRKLLKDVGAAGATTLLAAGTGAAKISASELEVAGQTGQPPENQPSQPAAGGESTPHSPLASAGPGKNDLAELACDDLVVTFDRRYGSIRSITRKGDPFETNFIGNEVNTPGIDVSNSRWTGDLVTHIWDVTDTNAAHRDWSARSNFVLKGRWRPELTGRSGDIRRASFDGNAFEVRYEGVSQNEGGIRSFNLTMSYRNGGNRSLLWDIQLRNATDHVLELGDLGFPLMVNDDQGEYYRDSKTGQPFPPDETEAPLRDPANSFSVYLEQFPRIAKQYHEKKVIAHHYIGGHSSYVLIERPLGDAPFLLLHAMQDTAFECIYRDESSFGENVYWWDGPNILAVHSWATKNLRRWNKNPWINGHSSLVLQPGEAWSGRLRFTFVESYDAIREELYKAGNLGIRVLPAMVVQENTHAYVEVKTKFDLEKIEFLSDNITVKERERVDDKLLLTLSFKGRGQKSLKLHYAGRWTNVHFYCIEDIEELLKARARFIVEREFYENPEDPYHRNHMFLPFDHHTGSTFLDSDEVSEVGGSDAEFGFSEPLFLAEKNAYYPSPKEVATLEAYITDCLFKYIQDPATYEVRASLYWKLRYPSSPWSHWTIERAKATYRSYNYAHVMNIYHAMYRVGRLYGLLTRKSPEDYLRMSYRTCLQMYRTVPWGHIGVMGGSNALNILDDLAKEGWQEEHGNLLEQIRKCNEVFLRDPYPYSSEYPADTTAQEQVYFFTRYFGNTEKNLKTVQIIKALRGGNQPVWFQYGNDNKGDLTCWYTESTNGWALLRAFEDTDEMDTFIKGYAGVMSVEVDLLCDGMCFAHFISTPGIFDFTPPRTLDGGIAQFGFLKAAKSYVVKDGSFGLIGCGCCVESSNGEIRVRPHDGVRKRLRFVPEGIDVEVEQAEVDEVVLGSNGKRWELRLSDSTGVVKKAEFEISGLERGEYLIHHGTSTARTVVTDTLELSVPIDEAELIRIEKM
jgi:hypothetical protein